MGDISTDGNIAFDDLFQHIGGAGLYQAVYFIILGALSITSVESIYINFVAAKLPHWCRVAELESLPFTVQKTVAIPSTNVNDRASTESLSQCDQFNYNYSSYTTEDFLNWNRTTRVINDIGYCKNGWVHDKSEFASSITSEWDLVCNDEWKVPLVSTIFVAGNFVGAISSGFLADKIGRRPTFVLYNIIKAGGGLFAAYAPNYAAMMVARMIVGVGSAGAYLTGFVLIMEVCSPKARTVYGIGIMLAFALGYMFVPAIAYAIRDFRKVQIAMAGPAFVSIFFMWLAPESPRWLIITGRFKQAEKVIRYIASVNGQDYPEWLDVSRIKAEDEKAANLPKRNIIDLLKRPTMRKCTLVVYFHWFTDSLVYYALSLNSGNLAGDIFLNTFLLGLVEVPANLICAFSLQWHVTGRRLTCCYSLLLAGIASLITIPLVSTGAVPGLTTALALVGKAGSTMGFSGIYVYTGELFPTEVRNVGMGTSSMFARISGMAAPFVGGLLGKWWKGLPYLIYGIFGVVAGLLVLLLPETLNQKLPETIDEAELLGSKRTAVAPTEASPRAEGSNIAETAAETGLAKRQRASFGVTNPAFEK